MNLICPSEYLEKYKAGIADRICEDLERKFEELNEEIAQAEAQGKKNLIITLKVKLLVCTKVLVRVHQRSPLLLVKSHVGLAESYLLQGYFPQSLEHLSLASSLNEALLDTIPDTKALCTHILNLLGKCHNEMNNADISIDYLQQALKFNSSYLPIDHLENIPVLSTLSQTFIIQKKYPKAFECMNSIKKIYEKQLGVNDPALIEVYEKMAEICRKQNSVKSGVDALKQKLDIMISHDIYSEEAAKVAEKVAKWAIEGKEYEESIKALRRAEKIYEINYGKINEKIAKVKGKICVVLLKADKFEEALQECLEIELIDKSIYKKPTQKYAKDLKIIANILMVLGKNDKALGYFEEARKIYSEFRNKKCVKEIKAKVEKINRVLKEDGDEAYDDNFIIDD